LLTFNQYEINQQNKILAVIFKTKQKLVPLLLFLLCMACQREGNRGNAGLVDYNFDIKPLLSDRCFACHGPDKNKQEGGLALHDPALAFKALESNANRFAIVPKRLGKSEVYRRIMSDDPAEMMPPPDSHLSLNEEEKDLIARWIKQGARYDPHWSFIPPKKAEPPSISQKDWAENEIDFFVLNRLEKEGITPAGKADKEVLIRRLSFAIRGLPPSLEEVDAFLAKDTPNAYEDLIDVFLASPAYGERMASHWLDVARYADSDGYLDDKHRDFSPWRDWVIQSFNENLSYKDFITYQLAGDLLPNATQEQILATAFNRLHKKNSEAGIVFEEYRSEYVSDRTNTLGKAVMALSLECAKCHDHKYDPISQEEYFQLYAFFNSTHELGHAVYGPDQTPGPALLLTDEKMDAKIAYLEALIERQAAKLAHEKNQLAAEVSQGKKKIIVQSKDIQRQLDQLELAHYSFDQILSKEGEKAETPNRRKSGENALLSNPVIKAGKKGQAFFVDDLASGRIPKGVGLFERTDPFTLDLWLYPDTIYEEAGILLHCENLRLGLKGYSLHLKDNRLSFIMAHSWPQNAIQLTTTSPLPTKQWTQVSITYDGSSQAAGLKIYADGLELETKVEQDHLYKGIIFEWNIHTYGFNGMTFGQRDKIKAFKNGGLDEIRIFKDALTPIEVLMLHDPMLVRKKLEQPDDQETQKQLQAFYYARMLPQMDQWRDSLSRSREEANLLFNSIPEIMVMGDLPQTRPTFILDRGNYDSPGKAVEPVGPARILPYDPSLPPNRLGLTQWLFDQRHPLTARVIVNRIWQLHFGTGLVKTTEDFGNQGELPSHPALLDYLSVWLMENDWNLKALHKKILQSATFQQDSRIRPELAEVDPENRLLARGPRFKLAAEMIRDNALAISGLLVEQIGGNSTYPYQPAGLWDEISNKGWRYRYLQEPGPGLYRRSVYSIWKRTSPPPSMLIFDVGNRDVCTVRRKPTDTPLQALVLLNDPQYQEASRILGQRVLQERMSSLKSKIARLFRFVFGRDPTSKEAEKMLAYYQDEVAQFEQNQEKALAYLSIGEEPWDEALVPSQVAAMGLLANALLNTYEASILQ